MHVASFIQQETKNSVNGEIVFGYKKISPFPDTI